MILAAGRGTRLAPLTDEIPKALVPIGGVPMLERVARRLIDAGTDHLIVNVHHLGEQVMRFLEESDNFGVRVSISDERELLLDTGGGLKAAGRHFREDSPFLLHNVDIVSDVDLVAMREDARENGALATLAVNRRDITRYLLFDEEGLCGYGNAERETEHRAREVVGKSERLGFCGIHAISPSIFSKITEENVFSIIPLYMRLVAEGEKILPHFIDGATWIDIGTHERLVEADEIFD